MEGPSLSILMSLGSCLNARTCFPIGWVTQHWVSSLKIDELGQLWWEDFLVFKVWLYLSISYPLPVWCEVMDTASGSSDQRQSVCFCKPKQAFKYASHTHLLWLYLWYHFKYAWLQISLYLVGFRSSPHTD